MDTNSKEYLDLILAAWLHDIGKFYQRAGYKLDDTNDSFAKEYLGRKRKVGQGPEAYYTHLHAIFSDKFIRENLSVLSVSGTLAALHHSPDNAATDRMRYLAKLITLADWMASGERRARESDEDREGYQAEPLISIFSYLQLDDEDGAKKREIPPAYVPLVALDSTLENLFPVKEKREAFSAGDGQKSYQELWQQFLADVSRLKNFDPEDLLRQIPFLLEKFTLTIPASTIDNPDLSLYHHLKSTAAIASCLYKLDLGEEIIDSIFDEIRALPVKPYKEKEKSAEILKQLNLIKREDFLLVSGDISGIQDFIYSVTSEKALKGLRGRSFYLQLISEIVARKILAEFNLTEANLIYCGGGHFHILLPRKDGAEEKLIAMKEKLDSILLQAHRGKLALILEWVPIRYADFFIDFATIWEVATAKTGQLKRRKFASLFTSPYKENHFQQILGPYDVGGERPACEICGEELEREREETGTETEEAEDTEEAEKICPLCQSFIFLSEDLNRSVAININIWQREDEITPEITAVKTWKDILSALGFDCRFWKRRKEKEKEEEREPGYLKEYLIFNSTNFAGKFAGYKFIAHKITGPDGETTLTLENMAEAADGIKRWGVLRADIDRLGRIFAEGLGDDRTISRMSMLSGLLSLYFNARLNHLSKIMEKSDEIMPLKYNQNKTPLDYIYIVYSGGDDLFLIGPWSFLPSLAASIAEDFNRFTCTQLTLSAGIYLAPSEKFPLYQAAREAGNAEEAAKRAGRNQVTFLERPLSWTKLKEAKEVAERIRNLIEGKANENIEDITARHNLLQGQKKGVKEVPRALLTILYDGYKEREMRLRGEISMERIWRLFYAFKRLMIRIKDEEILKELEWLLNKSITLTPGQDRYEIYPELNIAVRWAEYLTRKEKERR